VNSDGTLLLLGWNGSGQATPPTGVFTQVSVGLDHTCGLKSDGTLACWGDNYYGQATPPAGTFTQISAEVITLAGEERRHASLLGIQRVWSIHAACGDLRSGQRRLESYLRVEEWRQARLLGANGSGPSTPPGESSPRSVQAGVTPVGWRATAHSPAGVGLFGQSTPPGGTSPRSAQDLITPAGEE